MTHQIPTPPGLPILGHAMLFKSEFPMETQYLLTKQYGGIYRLFVPGRSVITISSHEFMHEVSDDKRFRKRISGTLTELRYAAGDGLLTATVPGEENWNIAHRVLAPTFSAISLRNFFDDMVDVVSQLVLKWERFGAHHVIDTNDDFTALSFEIICLTCMSYRINSFYTDGAHPFAFAVSDYNEQSFVLGTSGGLIKALRFGAKAKLDANKDTLAGFVDEMLEDRKARPPAKKDMLYQMLHKEDPVTGRKMTELSVKQNLLTLLMAGHETTSSLLTFVIYYLIQNPTAMRKLREEIDTILDGRQMTADDMSKLPYLIAVLRETLRLSPSAPARIVEATEDTTLGGGRYAIKKGDELIVCTYIAQRDPKVWGDDADEFRPERMLDGKFEALPPDAWQPFGVGIRACLGRAFAWQEAQIVLAFLVQHFTFVFADDQPARLRVRQTITIRPTELRVRAIPRTDRRGPVSLAARGGAQPPTKGAKGAAAGVNGVNGEGVGEGEGEGGVPMYVYFGSDMGTSEQFARRIAADAGRRGFKAAVAQLNAATASVPTDGPVVVVTASYEGKPPENAAHFVEWLGTLKDGACAGVAYAVFGCGNRDWVQTYQRVPTLVDAGLAAAGAERVVPRGEGDASAGDFFERFARWEDALWAALAERYDTKKDGAGEPQVDVEIARPGASRAKALAQEDTATTGTVVENRVLTAPGAPVKRHIEFQLPEGATFIAGDYLAVLPTNPPRDVRRALARFGLLPDQEITIKSAGSTSLPTGHPIAVSTLLSGYVELAQPATTRDLQSLSDVAKSEAEKLVFKELADNHTEQVVAERLSVLDILEAHPDIAIPFPAFLQLLPAMRVRQYSIASSPLADPTRAALTVRVFEAERTAGRGEPLLGVASSFLGALHVGDRVQLAVRPCKSAFRLPADPATPLVMICAGAGLAPMRGFLQERALQKRAGRDVAKSVLYFGCRDPEEDYLYSDSDLKDWTELDVVDVRPAFSRTSDLSLGCKYVQDRLWHDRSDVVAAWDAGAKLYLCGSAKMAAGVREKLVLIVQDALQLDRAAAVQHFSTTMADRFATDVFE